MKKTGLLSLICLIFAMSADANVISINFGYPRHNVVGTAGAPGANVGNWNNMTWGYYTGGTFTKNGLLLSDGTMLNDASASWDIDEIYSGVGTQTTDDASMMASYLNDKPPANNRAQNSLDPSYLTINNIGSSFADGYYVYIYSNQEDYTKPTVFTVSDGITSSTIVVNMADTSVNYLQGSGYVRDAGGNYMITNNPADKGNYAVLGVFTGSSVSIAFHGVDAGTPAGYSGSWRGQINAVQIVAVPEPTTIALLGISSFVTFLRRKR